ncbi:MAG: bacillithiol biosynthesis deacetylase BshB1 [Chitinophagales bacterium]
MKVDILAFGAHPDDIELSCAGILISHIAMGKKAAIVDLTRGELGTRGTPEIRDIEAANAAKIMGVSARENLGLEDGFFKVDKTNQLKVIQMIRKYRPEIVLANAPNERHPDHPRGAQLVVEAAFKAGLRMIETRDEAGNIQEAWRPKNLYHYIQSRHLEPDFVVDISEHVDTKMKSIMAYTSQFTVPNSNYNSDEPQTFLTHPAFLNRLLERSSLMGQRAGFTHAEGLIVNRTIGVKNLFEVF